MTAAVRMGLRPTEAGEVAVLSWHRPERKNALTTETAAALSEALARAAARPAAALVLWGEGGDFSAGADLEEVRAVARADEASALAFSRRLQRLADTLEALPVPTVAAIEGVCLGLGLELALAASARVAARDARLGLPEMRHGLYPAAGGTARLPEAVGEGRARAWILDARLVGADEALATGLVDAVVEPGNTLESAVALAAARARAAEAGAVFLAARRVGRGRAFEAALEAERCGFARLVRSEAVRKRLDAFLERHRVGPKGPP